MKIFAHFLFVVALLPALAFADGHLPSEAEVKTAIENYWNARNNNDHETVAAMEKYGGQ
jgi:hypothetical protein